MEKDIRRKFYDELVQGLEKRKIKAIIKIAHPSNGDTVKLNGIDLYKILEVPNPFKTRGVAIYRKLTDSALESIGGKRSRSKNPWVCAPLTSTNYEKLMLMLLATAETANRIRNKEMALKKGEKKDA